MKPADESPKTMNRPAVHIVHARAGDLPTVARLHRTSLPRGFLSQLGDRVLRELYAGIGSHADSIVLVAVDSQDQVLGYVSGTTDVSRCYRHVLLHRGLPIALGALPSLLRSSTIRRVFETLAYPLRFRKRSDTTIEPRPVVRAELLSIAVHESARGLRVGQQLVDELEAFLVSHIGNARYRVVTDANDPRSNAFYEKVGFARLTSFEHHGHPMMMYTKDLRPESASGS